MIRSNYRIEPSAHGVVRWRAQGHGSPRRGETSQQTLLAIAGGAVVVFALLVFFLWPRGPRLAQLKGTVTFQNKPVSNEVRIAFLGKETRKFIAAEIDASGQYRVGVAAGWGLPPGPYQVAILAPDWPPDFPTVPLRYRAPETSGLTLELTSAGAQFDVNMEPDPNQKHLGAAPKVQ